APRRRPEFGAGPEDALQAPQPLPGAPAARPRVEDDTHVRLHRHGPPAMTSWFIPNRGGARQPDAPPAPTAAPLTRPAQTLGSRGRPDPSGCAGATPKSAETQRVTG